jgi:hypothetical protein
MAQANAILQPVDLNEQEIYELRDDATAQNEATIELCRCSGVYQTA